MKFTKVTLTLAVLALIICCAGSDKKAETADPTEKEKKDNRIYYLSIGNGYYDREKGDGFMDVPGANTSADHVAEILSCYGDGITLKSSRDSLLSKKRINEYVDKIIAKAIKDSLSTTFIYYCGHGFSDKIGTVFMVPGDHEFREKQVKSMESLISVNDIQQKIVDAMRKYYPDPKLTEAEQEAIKVRYQNHTRTGETAEKANNFAEVLQKEFKAKQAQKKRPRFIILADCCTENFDVINYNVLLKDSRINKQFEEVDKRMEAYVRMAEASGNTEQAKQVKAMFEDAKVSLTGRQVKSEIWINGNKTVYTGEIGMPVQMVTSLKNEKKLVGPICRRLELLFQKGKKTFRNYEILERLCDADFDSKSVPAKFEVTNREWFGEKEQSGIKTYRGKVASDAYLDKRDSIPFHCGMR